MAKGPKIPKQRGGGDTGNTNWGHRNNRIDSGKRGGNAHAKRGSKKGIDCLFMVLVLGVMPPVGALLIMTVFSYVKTKFF